MPHPRRCITAKLVVVSILNISLLLIRTQRFIITYLRDRHLIYLSALRYNSFLLCVCVFVCL